MSSRKRLFMLGRGRLSRKQMRSFKTIQNRPKKVDQMDLDMLLETERELQRVTDACDMYRQLCEDLVAKRGRNGAQTVETDAVEASDSGDCESGSSVDSEFDSIDDNNPHLINDGVVDVMRRAAKVRTTHNMLTGLTVAQFESLAEEMYDFIANTTLTGEKCITERSDVEHWVISPPMQLFITLVWARRYEPFAFLAFFFQLPARYVAKMVRRVTAAGARWAAGRLCWPQNEAEAAALIEDHECLQYDNSNKQILNIGVTPIRVASRPSPAEQEADDQGNANHAVRAVNVLIITDLRGRIVWLRGPFVGTESAELAECKAELRAHLRRLDLPIASDAGFVMNEKGVPQNLWCSHYQTVDPSLMRLTKFVLDNDTYFDNAKVDFFQRIYDSTRYVSQGRGVVERAIGHLKTFAVFRETWRGRIKGVHELDMYSVCLSDVVQFIGAVVARRIDDIPKRDADFKLSRPAGAKYYYGYPGSMSVEKLMKPAARQFVPRQFVPRVQGENSSRSIKRALVVAEKGAAAAKRALECGEVQQQKKARRGTQSGAKAKLPDIVPPEDKEAAAGDDTIYAADVDPDEDDELVFRCSRKGAREKRVFLR